MKLSLKIKSWLFGPKTKLTSEKQASFEEPEDPTLHVKVLDAKDLDRRYNLQIQTLGISSYYGVIIREQTTGIVFAANGRIVIPISEQRSPAAEVIVVFLREQTPDQKMLNEIRNSIASASSVTPVVAFMVHEQDWDDYRLRNSA